MWVLGIPTKLRSVDDSSRVWIYFAGMSRIILALFTIIIVFMN
jgi:hypothetical protein